MWTQKPRTLLVVQMMGCFIASKKLHDSNLQEFHWEVQINNMHTNTEKMTQTHPVPKQTSLFSKQMQLHNQFVHKIMKTQTFANYHINALHRRRLVNTTVQGETKSH